MSLLSRIKQHFMAPGSGLGLGIFRIVYSLVMLAEVLELLYFHDLIYGEVPGDTWHVDNHFQVLLLVWAGAVCAMVLGLWMRPATIINYVLTVVFMGTFSTFSYHVDYFFLGVNFLLIFIPARTAFSVKLPEKWGGDRGPAQTATWRYVALIGMIGVAFVYTDSVFTKLDSPMWRDGLGMFTPAALPIASWTNLDFVLDQEWLVRGTGWAVLIFEILLIFLLPFQCCRVPLAFFGFLFHIGICIAFPIPWFGLAVASYYLMLFPDWVWIKLFRLVGLGRFAEVPPVNAGRAQKMWRWGWMFFCVSFVLQVIMSSIHPGVRRVLPDGANQWFASTRATIHPWTREFLGMTRHGVFMDGHFANYNHAIAVVYRRKGKETWLPITTQEGRPGAYMLGRTWVYHAFRVNGPHIDQSSLESGLRRWTWFWAVKNRVRLSDAEFVVKVKKVAPHFVWQKDVTEEQMATPWNDVGTIRWKEFKCEVSLPIIEDL